ncbi:hypothetical protein [Salinarimonas rosea]|uniref:hypothetical protein n=1 Tax=Salinarimonas rosea TaxID=552063 RepID=UPI0004103A19|nr:hypothetical protein [Salinarimonas rosea]
MATILLASLSMGMAFCHLLEMPARFGWDAELWVGTTVVGEVFALFGTVGAAIETGAWIAAVALALMVRNRSGATFITSAAGAAFLVAAFVAWWAFVFPVNAEMSGWTVASLPENWEAWRAQWEYAHAGRAVLLLAGLGGLVLSVVLETPRERPAGEATPARAR